MKFITYALSALAVLFVGAFLVAFAVGDFNIQIAEEDAQDKIAAILPVTVSKAGIAADVEGINIDMRDTGQVAIGGVGAVGGFGMNADFTFEAMSGIRYDDGRFYLTDIDLGDVKILPSSETEEIVEERKTLLLSTVARMRDRFAQGDEETAEAFDEEAGRIGIMVRERVKEIASRTMKETPIYDMNTGSWKVRAASLALKDVQIADGRIDVTVSAFSFLINVMKIMAIWIVAILATIGLMGAFIFPSHSRT